MTAPETLNIESKIGIVKAYIHILETSPSHPDREQLTRERLVEHRKMLKEYKDKYPELFI